MPKILIKSQLFPNKQKLESKPELKYTNSSLPPNIQTFKRQF